MREQAVLLMENLKTTLAAAGCTLADVVSATRYLTDVAEQDDLNAVWASYLGAHRPTTTTVEVSRLATHANCKIEISVIAVAADDDAPSEPSKQESPHASGAGMTTTLGFVGLGAMGGRMARRLLDAGYALCGHNRTAAKAADLVRAGMIARRVTP